MWVRGTAVFSNFLAPKIEYSNSIVSRYTLARTIFFAEIGGFDERR